MKRDIVDQGDLSVEIAKLRELVDKAEGQPALQRSLIETLNRVCLDQDRRNLFHNNVLGRETVFAYAKSISDAVAQVLRDELGDGVKLYRIVDRLQAVLALMPEPINSPADLKLLK